MPRRGATRRPPRQTSAPAGEQAYLLSSMSDKVASGCRPHRRPGRRCGLAAWRRRPAWWNALRRRAGPVGGTASLRPRGAAARFSPPASGGRRRRAMRRRRNGGPVVRSASPPQFHPQERAGHFAVDQQGCAAPHAGRCSWRRATSLPSDFPAGFRTKHAIFQLAYMLPPAKTHRPDNGERHQSRPSMAGIRRRPASPLRSAQSLRGATPPGSEPGGSDAVLPIPAVLGVAYHS